MAARGILLEVVLVDVVTLEIRSWKMRSCEIEEGCGIEREGGEDAGKGYIEEGRHIGHDIVSFNGFNQCTSHGGCEGATLVNALECNSESYRYIDLLIGISEY